jgi:hypothetical protein
MNYRQHLDAGPLADRWGTAHHPTRLVIFRITRFMQKILLFRAGIP